MYTFIVKIIGFKVIYEVFIEIINYKNWSQASLLLPLILFWYL